ADLIEADDALGEVETVQDGRDGGVADGVERGAQADAVAVGEVGADLLLGEVPGAPGGFVVAVGGPETGGAGAERAVDGQVASAAVGAEVAGLLGGAQLAPPAVDGGAARFGAQCDQPGELVLGSRIGGDGDGVLDQRGDAEARGPIEGRPRRLQALRYGDGGLEEAAGGTVRHAPEQARARVVVEGVQLGV